MIINIADLPGLREKHKGQRMILAGGAYDILHQGHIDYLRDVKALGDILVVALKSDAEIRSYKEEGRPIQNEDVRATVLDAIRYVDYVVIAPEGKEGDAEPARMQVARALKPDVIVSVNPKWNAYRDELKGLGVELKIQPIEKVNSTTSIIERIRNRPEA